MIKGLSGVDMDEISVNATYVCLLGDQFISSIEVAVEKFRRNFGFDMDPIVARQFSQSGDRPRRMPISM